MLIVEVVGRFADELLAHSAGCAERFPGLGQSPSRFVNCADLTETVREVDAVTSDTWVIGRDLLKNCPARLN